MSVVLNPYIAFQGQARAALDFYQSVFGGEVNAMTFGEFGMEGVAADQVMHGQLTTPDGFTIMCSDTPEGMEYNGGSRITISLSGDDQRLVEWFTRLGEGGQVTLPMGKQMWGDTYGQLTDRFGVNWMANLSGQQS